MFNRDGFSKRGRKRTFATAGYRAVSCQLDGLVTRVKDKKRKKGEKENKREELLLSRKRARPCELVHINRH